MKKNIKHIILSLTILIMFIYFSIVPINSENTDNLKDKSILVLCSYNSQNMWESSILNGLREGLDNRLSFTVEYLDSKSSNSREFISSFVDLLNVKYKNKNLDCILALDDEALMLAKSLIFDESSFMYHKKVVFAGVNNYIPLSEQEQKYIKGIFEYQDNSQLVDIILDSSPRINTLYLLLDNSTYSSTIEANIENLTDTMDKSFKVKTLKGRYINDIKDDIKNINSKNSAIILSGIYIYGENNEFPDTDFLISEIKSLTKAPIYTTLSFYVKSGAIGGKVNDGHKLGQILSNLLINTFSEDNNLDIPISFNNSFSKLLFNYDELMRYNLDPSVLPQGTEFINKGPFDLLVSKPMKMSLYSIIILILCLLVFLVISHRKERKTLERKKKLLKESLERDEIRTDFVLTLSHELRTPLNIITNATSLLKLKISKKNVNLDFFDSQLEIISKNSNRLLRLINNLIDVSKIELGYMDSSFKNDNIVEVIEDATMSVVDLANSHDINILFDTEEEEIITSIDKSKMERIMLNLLSNSIKFTNPGGEIFVNIEKKDNIIVITVKDSGIGMSDSLQENLFEKFKKEDSYSSLERPYEGSGLGLYIVKGLVSLHNGSIEVFSEVGKGTTFVISIPQVIIDFKDEFSNSSWAPIDYVSKIELSDIDKN